MKYLLLLSFIVLLSCRTYTGSYVGLYEVRSSNNELTLWDTGVCHMDIIPKGNHKYRFVRLSYPNTAYLISPIIRKDSFYRWHIDSFKGDLLTISTGPDSTTYQYNEGFDHSVKWVFRKVKGLY